MHARQRHDRLIQLYEDGHFAEAVSLALDLMDESPDDGRLLELYGTACWKLKEFDHARNALEEASALVPLRPASQFALASCYVLDEKPDLAAMMFVHLAGLVRCTGMLSAVATRLGALGRYESALEVCLKIQDLDPTHHQAHFGVAYYLNHLGNPPEALIPPLSMAVDLAPHVLHYRINLAFVLSDAGRTDEAARLLADVPLERVGCPCVVRRMMDLFSRAGDHGRALCCQVRLSCLKQ